MPWDAWKKLVGAVTREADRLDRPDLKRAALDAVLGLARRGAREAVVLPAAVDVRVVASGGGAEAARAFVEEPAFSEEILAELQNRLPTLQGPPPLLRYEVVEGERDEVSARPAQLEAAGWLRVEDGDRAGQVTALTPRRARWTLGRSPRGATAEAANDVVLTERAAFVSRRAAALRRAGARWEIEPLDQGAALEVERAGARYRPRDTITGRLALEPGDLLCFLGPGGEQLRARLLDRDPRQGE